MEREMLFALSERKHYYCIILLSISKLIAFFSFPLSAYNLRDTIREELADLLDFLLHAIKTVHFQLVHSKLVLLFHLFDTHFQNFPSLLTTTCIIKKLFVFFIVTCDIFKFS